MIALPARPRLLPEATTDRRCRDLRRRTVSLVNTALQFQERTQIKVEVAAQARFSGGGSCTWVLADLATPAVRQVFPRI